MKVQLGPFASIFHDPVSGLLITRGEIVEIPDYDQSYLTRNALKGGHLVKVQESEAEVKTEVPVTNEPSPRFLELVKKTRKAIMLEFPFLDEDDLAEANLKATKEELVNFLLEVEKHYE
jgi:hypothetical protein